MKAKTILFLLTLVSTPLAVAEQDAWDAYTNAVGKVLVPLSNAFSKKIISNLKSRPTPPPQSEAVEIHREANRCDELKNVQNFFKFG